MTYVIYALKELLVVQSVESFSVLIGFDGKGRL
jgi:hypothetical protein